LNLALILIGQFMWAKQIKSYNGNTIVNRFPLPPGAPLIGDTSLTHVMRLAAHSTTSPMPTAMVKKKLVKAPDKTKEIFTHLKN
jgi:hypothetical protein